MSQDKSLGRVTPDGQLQMRDREAVQNVEEMAGGSGSIHYLVLLTIDVTFESAESEIPPRHYIRIDDIETQLNASDLPKAEISPVVIGCNGC